MKVTIFDPGNFVPHYVAAFRASLEAEGVETALITSPPLFDKETRAEESTHFLFFPWLTGDWRKALRRRRWVRWMVKAFSYPQGLIATYRFMRSERVDVFHVQWTLLPLLDSVLLRLIRRRGCRIVVTAHDPPPPPSRVFSRANQLRALAVADSIVVHTRSQADELLASYASLASRIEVIPHGASAAVPPTPREKLQHRHTLKIAPECRLLLFFGMIKRYKGLDVLIDAMPSVLERFGDAHLLIAGEPFYPLREIERHVRRLGISKHVTIRAGYVPASHVQHYFRAADALVAPYVGGGASGVVLGAQANALPVICSRTEGLQDLVEHRVTGLMAEPRSRDSLANAICDALADPEAFSQMGLAAWLRVKRDNSWDTVAAKTVSLYHQARADARHMTRPVLAALR